METTYRTRLPYLMLARTWRVSGQIQCHSHKRNVTSDVLTPAVLALPEVHPSLSSSITMSVPSTPGGQECVGYSPLGNAYLSAGPASKWGSGGSGKASMQAVHFPWLHYFMGSHSLEVHWGSVLHFKHLTSQILHWADMKTKPEVQLHLLNHTEITEEPGLVLCISFPLFLTRLYLISKVMHVHCRDRKCTENKIIK